MAEVQLHLQSLPQAHAVSQDTAVAGSALIPSSQLLRVYYKVAVHELNTLDLPCR